MMLSRSYFSFLTKVRYLYISRNKPFMLCFIIYIDQIWVYSSHSNTYIIFLNNVYIVLNNIGKGMDYHLKNGYLFKP